VADAAVTEAVFSKSEMMIVAAARELAGQHVCFVGVGLPNIAVNLAKRTVAPDLELVYEAGVFGARPARLPLSIGDPTIVTGATAVVSMLELFGYYLQRGLIDVGFLGAAQIDRFGNINTTVIGPYDHPTTRLPGSGGACEIAINAREVFVIMRQSKRSFVERIDFRTSPGNLGGAEEAERIRREGGWLGRGPTVVVTDLGIYHFSDDGEMRLDSLHPGATVDAVRDTIGFVEIGSVELDDRVRRVPLVSGLRVQQVDATGSRLEGLQCLGAGRPAIVPGVASDDHGRSRVDARAVTLPELVQDGPIVGVPVGPDHVGPEEHVADLEERGDVLEVGRDLVHAVDERERPHPRELRRHRLEQGQGERGELRDGTRHVAQHVQIGPRDLRSAKDRIDRHSSR
jgi:glutaconate CoA-transferase subunit B